MSNSLAIAAATSGLRWILERSLTGPEPGPVSEASVTTLRPDKLADLIAGDDPASGLNVFCYQIAPNPAWNLHDLPTRHANGTLARRPIAAVDLHYLVTGYGNDASLDDQRLLARAVLALAVTPMLTRPVLDAAIGLFKEEDGLAFLSLADLADQPDLVKFAPAPLTLEELSKLWGIFGTHYLPSLTYRASVVLLEAQVAPRTALPVQSRQIGVRAAGPPRLAALTVVGNRPASSGSQLILDGSGLRGDAQGPADGQPVLTRVQVGATELIPSKVSTDRIEVTLTDAVPAGVHQVRVLHRTDAQPGGSPARVRASSNSQPLLVTPAVTVEPAGPGAAAPIVLRLAPPIHAGQRAVATLQRLTEGDPDDPAWLSFEVLPTPPGSPQRPTIELDRAAVTPGRWLIRVEVAGAESIPTLVDGSYAEPAVTV